MKNKLTTIVNLMYTLIALLFYLDFFTSFDIKEECFKLFIYYANFILIPLILFCNFKYIKLNYLRVLSLIIPTVSILFILVSSPSKIIFLSSSWKTQEIIYEHGHLSFKKIEYQIKNKGALGYDKRIVKVIYLTKYFMITKPVNENIDTKVEWIKVNKEINEMKLNY